MKYNENFLYCSQNKQEYEKRVREQALKFRDNNTVS